RSDAAFEHREGDGRMYFGKLFQHHKRIEIAQALAAITLIDIDAEEAHLAQLPQTLAGHRLVALFDSPRHRPQLAVCIFARQLPELSLVGREREGHLFHSMNNEFTD